MKHKKALQTIYRKRCILAMTLVLSLFFAPAQTIVEASALDNAQKIKNEAQENLDEINDEIAGIQSAQNSLQAEMASYDEQMMILLTDMEILRGDIQTQEMEIEQANADLANAEAEAQGQYDSMKVRIQYMYENGEQSIWTALIEAESMTDLLNRVEYVSDVYEYDRQLLTDYQEIVAEVEALQEQLENEMAEMQELELCYEEQETSLQQIIAQKQVEMDNFDSQLANAQALANQYAQTIKQQNQIIAKEKARLEAEATANASNNNSTTGGFSSTGLTDGGLNPSYTTGVNGNDVVAYASQFVGNPYVLGGTSLTNGTDCSYFVMAVYRNFGISLPRTSYAQRTCGQAVSYENARPGDIICYSGHVAIYIGNGRIVHASNPRTGICYGSATYRTIVSVRRVL